MTVGLSVANTANAWLNTLTGLTAQLHTGDPGAAGTANVSSNPDKVAMTLAAAAGGSRALSGTPEWPAWDGIAESVSHVSVWEGATFRYSFALAQPKPVTPGDTFRLTGHTFALVPLAAA